jgi:hypothetical protein
MKHLLKELGKYFFDVSKIILAVAVIAPVAKDTHVSIGALFLASVLFAVGATLTHKGGKENE